jgi:hypothetical protein
MTRLLLCTATILALSASANAEPLSEETKERLTAANLKICLKKHDTPGHKRTYSPSEIRDFCSCQAVKTADATTKEIWEAANETGDFSTESTKILVAEAVKYCRKYLNQPDVTEIRKRKW